MQDPSRLDLPSFRIQYPTLHVSDKPACPASHAAPLLPRQYINIFVEAPDGHQFRQPIIHDILGFLTVGCARISVTFSCIFSLNVVVLSSTGKETWNVGYVPIQIDHTTLRACSAILVSFEPRAGAQIGVSLTSCRTLMPTRQLKHSRQFSIAALSGRIKAWSKSRTTPAVALTSNARCTEIHPPTLTKWRSRANNSILTLNMLNVAVGLPLSPLAWTVLRWSTWDSRMRSAVI